MSQRTTVILFAVAAAAAVIAGGWLALCRSGQCSGAPGAPAAGPASGGGRALRVVAAENFWGSLAAQIGGPRVEVLSIVSDPNADPHEYEASAADARAVAAANYVIENGAGYDSWMDKLLGASTEAGRKALNVAALLGKTAGDNPHFWYDPDYVNRVAAQMEQDLASLDPADAASYEARYQALQSSLAPYQSRIMGIKLQFGGAKVAATEDIFAYLASAAGLDLVSPMAFTQAVSEGNDPTAASIAAFEGELRSGEVRVLVYNKQTITPITGRMKELAAQEGIPVVGITEIIQPPDISFEEWMDAELVALQGALSAKAQ